MDGPICVECYCPIDADGCGCDDSAVSAGYLPMFQQWKSQSIDVYGGNDYAMEAAFVAGMLAAAEIAESTEENCYAPGNPCRQYDESECPDKSTIFCAIAAIRAATGR